jgi:hypothetical protein
VALSGVGEAALQARVVLGRGEQLRVLVGAG